MKKEVPGDGDPYEASSFPFNKIRYKVLIFLFRARTEAQSPRVKNCRRSDPLTS